MFNTNNGYSLADIAAATGTNNRNDGMFNGDGSWWIIILFLFVFSGWGNNGFGVFGGGNAGSAAGYTLATDFANLERKIDGVNQGLCDGFYAMNTGMLNGFSGLQNTITGEFRSTDNAICNLGYQTQAGVNSIITSNMQNTNAIVGQLTNMAADNAACCCETQRQIERGFADTNYNLATQMSDTRRIIADTARDIVDNQNANTRSILDFLTQDKIATLTAENQSLKFAASQAAQNAYLTNELRPCPIPAYVVQNPYCCTTGYVNSCGY